MIVNFQIERLILLQEISLVSASKSLQILRTYMEYPNSCSPTEAVGGTL